MISGMGICSLTGTKLPYWNSAELTCMDAWRGEKKGKLSNLRGHGVETPTKG